MWGSSSARNLLADYDIFTAASQTRSSPLQAGIQQVPERVAEQVDPQNREKDTEAWKQRQPPRGADVDARVGEHRAPGGDLGGNAETEKAQARLDRKSV